MNKSIVAALAGLAMLGATPSLAQGIGHKLFMRGSIVETDGAGPVVCIGKADGATVGQTLEVYRAKQLPGPGKSPPTYRRDLVGHVIIDHIFDDHFAHVRVADGAPAKHDIVELVRN
ncbi:hypothetical protein [Caulobacter sp. 1776]|uniref:hypothetical protein n=1 Tax=Caulobacter sp. 1776 TaxID=3156420 RepID=UPI003390D469